MSTLRDRFAARQWLQQFRRDPMAMSSLRHMLATEGGAFRGLDRTSDDALLDQAAVMLEHGRWHVHGSHGSRHAGGRQTSRNGAGTDSGADDDTQETARASLIRKTTLPPETAPPALTWVEIRLVDSEGNPVPGESYEIVLPDGSIRSGTLNGKGVARYDLIPAGQCDVRFPNLDANAWRPA
jgi:hypothetical protein